MIRVIRLGKHPASFKFLSSKDDIYDNPWVVVEPFPIILRSSGPSYVIHTTFGDCPGEIPSSPNKRPVTGPSMKALSTLLLSTNIAWLPSMCIWCPWKSTSRSARPLAASASLSAFPPRMANGHQMIRCLRSMFTSRSMSTLQPPTESEPRSTNSSTVKCWRSCCGFYDRKSDSQ